MVDDAMNSKSEPLVHVPAPDLPPPASTTGIIGWLRANLFSTPVNSALTILSLILLYLIVPPILSWAFIDAQFNGDSRAACQDSEGLDLPGACWVFVKIRFNQFMYGFYPVEEQWRANLVGIVGLAGLVYCLWDGLPGRRWMAVFMCFIFPFIAAYFLLGHLFGIGGLTHIETSKWGGLLLTLVISATGIAASLPLGILLALGRRSQMPVIRMLCIGFIELVRAVPLITVLFMAFVILPLFLPPGTSFDQLGRALIGVSLFSAAYMAEVVRGGLQAIPKGQYEAGDAMGLTYWQKMRLIILPQALKIVIPAIVSSFIGLFKDTTLVLIVGLSDLLQMTKLAVTDSKWIGLAAEGYVFAGFVFFIFCFGMSRYSMYLERKLHTGH